MSRGVYSYDSKSGATSKTSVESVTTNQYRPTGGRTRRLTGTSDHVRSSNGRIVLDTVDGGGTEEVFPRSLESVVESSDQVGGHEDCVSVLSRDSIEEQLED